MYDRRHGKRRKKRNVRVVHVAPVHQPEQVHTPGLEHHPPLKHPDGQTAIFIIRCESFLLEKNLRVVQVAPLHDAVQVQVFGAVHAPPF